MTSLLEQPAGWGLSCTPKIPGLMTWAGQKEGQDGLSRGTRWHLRAPWWCFHPDKPSTREEEEEEGDEEEVAWQNPPPQQQTFPKAGKLPQKSTTQCVLVCPERWQPFGVPGIQAGSRNGVRKTAEELGGSPERSQEWCDPSKGSGFLQAQPWSLPVPGGHGTTPCWCDPAQGVLPEPKHPDVSASQSACWASPGPCLARGGPSLW